MGQWAGTGATLGRITTATLAVTLTLTLALVAGACGGSGNGDDAAVPDEAVPDEALDPERYPRGFPDAARLEVPPVDPAVVGDLRFSDATVEAGLALPHAERALQSPDDLVAGAAAEDYDGDGDIDLYVTRIGLPNLLYRNDGRGRFTDVAAEAGVQGPVQAEGYAGASFGDVTGDGHLDLYLTSGGRTGAVLFVNRGDGTFEDDTAARGLALAGAEQSRQPTSMFGATMSDWDQDGDLDLLSLQWDTQIASGLGVGERAGANVDGARRSGVGACGMARELRRAGYERQPGSDDNRSRFYLNDGSGNFTEAGPEIGLELDKIIAFTGVFADVTGDGWEDLLITGDGCTSRLYRNDAGKRFQDITEESGTGTDENGMGSVVADLDQDGEMDWFISSIGYPTADGTCPVYEVFVGCSGNRLYLGSGDGEFRDATDEFGVRDGYWGWGAVAADLDNDGDPDLAQAAGYEEGSLYRTDDGTNPLKVFFKRFAEDPLRLWLNTGEGPWPEVAQLVGLTDLGPAKALVPLDADGDGDLDLFVANSGENPVYYRNDTPAGRAWLDIRLEDPGAGDRRGIGARIVVTPGGDRPTTVGDVRGGGSYQSQDPAVMHVGLGDLSGPVERIDVYWPGEEKPQRLTDVETRRTVVVRRDQ